MRMETIVGDKKVVTFGLKDSLHNVVVSMLTERPKTLRMAGYSLEEPDGDMVDVWIDNAKEDGYDDYENFLVEAKNCAMEFYIFNDNLIRVSQTLGEVAVFNI